MSFSALEFDRYLLPSTMDDSNYQHMSSTRAHNFKPYKCEKCGAQYTHKNNLTIHKRNDCNQIKRFKCDFCSYRSYRKECIKKHTFRKHRYVSAWSILYIFWIKCGFIYRSHWQILILILWILKKHIKPRFIDEVWVNKACLQV